ncbi:OmpA family protein [Thiohalocapsa halophila]|nr:OmpA family protein [Thiohalocapsa halophila]
MPMRALALSSAGLLLLAVLYALALPRLAERIPETLRETAEVRLETAGLTWIQVRADGRDLLLHGPAPSPAEQRRAVELAAGVPGVRRVVDEIQLRAVSPYRLSMTRQDDAIAVSGYMPDQASLDALAGQVQARGGAGALDLEVAAGHPPGWTALVSALIEPITALDQASAELADGALSIAGVTTSVDTRDRVLAALSELKAEGVTVDAEITATVSPYTMTLTKADGTLAVRGFVPDGASSRRLTQHLTRRPAGPEATTAGTTEVALREATGAPDGWLKLVQVLVDALPRFDHAEAQLSDRRLRLAGSLPTTAERDQLVEALRTFEAQGYALDLDLSAADAAALRCQARLDELLLTPILFAPGQARIGADSDALLEALAQAVMACPDARIRIAGHTDDRGRPEANLRLSRERAQAVAARLIAAGVEPARITAVGYGDERPVADNATAAGRAKNRRIEFDVEANP